MIDFEDISECLWDLKRKLLLPLLQKTTHRHIDFCINVLNTQIQLNTVVWNGLKQREEMKMHSVQKILLSYIGDFQFIKDLLVLKKKHLSRASQ